MSDDQIVVGNGVSAAQVHILGARFDRFGFAVEGLKAGHGGGVARLFRGHWFPLDPPRHFFHFGPGSLTAALAAAGFRVERMRHLSWEQNLYGVIQSALNSLGFPRDDLYETLKGNRPLGSKPRDLVEVLLLAVGFLPAVLFTAGEAAFRHGGTIECVAIRTDG